jgi:hypothetical protein
VIALGCGGAVVQIKLEDSVGFPTCDVQYLNDQLLRFRLVSPRTPGAYHRFFLGEYSSADQLFPDAPNRKAIDYNLATLAKVLDAGLARMRDRHFVEGAFLTSRRDFLEMNIDHFCRPALLYTNGQAVVSLVRRNQGRFELAYHPSLSAFCRFGSDYEFGILDANQIKFATTFDDAERSTHERLSHVATYALRVQTESELDELVLQPAGTGRRDTHGDHLETLIATFRGDSFRLQLGGRPGSDNEPYRVLNELRPAGFHLVVCATCEHFHFSRMARDMSSGSKGYCTDPSRKNPGFSLSNIVSVRDWCPEYRFVADEERQTPYLRHG